MTSVDTEVVVVGGGIGGLATAFALAREGRAVQVLERAAEFTEVGAGLQMAPNATRLLAGWGLLERVVEVGVRPSRLTFMDALSGEELTSLDLGEDFRARYGAPYVVLHRTDLLQVLVDACRDAGVVLRTHADVTDVVPDADGATAVLGDGQVRAEVVVAADGLRSTLRGRFDPTAPVASGYVAYRGAFAVADLPGDQVPTDLDEVVVHLGPGCHLVQYALRRGEILNTVAVFASPGLRPRRGGVGRPGRAGGGLRRRRAPGPARPRLAVAGPAVADVRPRADRGLGGGTAGPHRRRRPPDAAVPRAGCVPGPRGRRGAGRRRPQLHVDRRRGLGRRARRLRDRPPAADGPGPDDRAHVGRHLARRRGGPDAAQRAVPHPPARRPHPRGLAVRRAGRRPPPRRG